MNWFKPFGWVYLPVSAEGFMVTALAVFFLVPIFIAIVHNGHSVSDDLYHMFVYASCTAFWWKWVAEKTSIPTHESPIDH